MTTLSSQSAWKANKTRRNLSAYLNAELEEAIELAQKKRRDLPERRRSGSVFVLEAVVAKLLDELTEAEIKRLIVKHRGARLTYSVSDAWRTREYNRVLAASGPVAAERWERELERELKALVRRMRSE